MSSNIGDGVIQIRDCDDVSYNLVSYDAKYLYCERLKNIPFDFINAWLLEEVTNYL